MVIAAGDDWHQPYGCEDWSETFGLTYPILDDDNGNIYSLFGTGYIPHNVIIDDQGMVLYSQSGFNQSAIISIINSALENIKNKTLPEWLAFDIDSKQGIIQGMPTREDVKLPIEEQLIVELYSR